MLHLLDIMNQWPSALFPAHAGVIPRDVRYPSMKRYHINPETGRVNQCSAVQKCRFGQEEGEHFSRREEAQRAAEELLAAAYGPLGTQRKNPSKASSSSRGAPSKEPAGPPHKKLSLEDLRKPFKRTLAACSREGCSRGEHQYGSMAHRACLVKAMGSRRLTPGTLPEALWRASSDLETKELSLPPRGEASSEAYEDLQAYTGVEAGRINRLLRTESISTRGAAIRLLDEAVSSARTSEEGYVYRGMPDLPQLQVGERITDDAFLSVSTRASGALPFAEKTQGVLVKLLLPKGTPCVAPLMCASEEDRLDPEWDEEELLRESELVLPRGSTFEVVAREGSLVVAKLLLLDESS